MKVLEGRHKPPAQQVNGVSNPGRTGAIGARLFAEQHPDDPASLGCLCYSGGMLPEGPGRACPCSLLRKRNPSQSEERGRPKDGEEGEERVLSEKTPGERCASLSDYPSPTCV